MLVLIGILEMLECSHSVLFDPMACQMERAEIVHAVDIASRCAGFEEPLSGYEVLRHVVAVVVHHTDCVVCRWESLHHCLHQMPG